MGENHFAAAPIALYGVVLLMAAIAYWHPAAASSSRRRARIRCWERPVGRDWKGKVSPLLYLVAIPVGVLCRRGFPVALYVLVALIWLVPDRRIENVLSASEDA